MSLLSIKGLSVHYITDDAVIRAVNGIDLDVEEGETVGLVGETGAGKTTTALSVMGLIPEPPGKVVGGEILYNGEDLLKKSQKEMRSIRGDQISMIFQDPMTALDPVIPVGDQIAESILLHSRCTKKEAREKARDMLDRVGIDPDRAVEYPYQFSGGMKQRVVIAIALACNPKLLIADEPTTALDVTIQAHVLAMINELKTELKTSVIFITHDLGIVAETCDKVAIMYAGEIVEFGGLEALFDHPKHPYTVGLFDSIPRLDRKVEFLKPVAGLMPDPANLPDGCSFHDRCPFATKRCSLDAPPVVDVDGKGHMVRCWRCTDER